MSLLTLLIVFLLLSLVFGGWGSRRDWGYAGWSPLGLIVVVLVLLYLLGGLR